jgi:transcriptional regulator with XRE-family HTH domain
MIIFSGKRLSKIRKQNGLSMQQVADHIGVSRQSVYNWETSATTMIAVHLHALTRLFKKEVGYFFVSDKENK